MDKNLTGNGVAVLFHAFPVSPRISRVLALGRVGQSTSGRLPTSFAPTSSPKLAVRSWSARSPSSFLVAALPQKLPHQPPPRLSFFSNAANSSLLSFALAASRLRWICSGRVTHCHEWTTRGRPNTPRGGKEQTPSVGCCPGTLLIEHYSGLCLRHNHGHHNSTQPPEQPYQRQHDLPLQPR